MMRHKGKQILTILRLAAALVGMLVLLPAAAAASLVTSIVTDPLTGAAIEGYDPVSYFTEPDPLPGKPDFEFYWQGVPWYFASEANRDVFMRHPEVYAPQFGGHCLMSLSRGYLSDGKPRLYVVHGMKLYLFYSVANREAFLSSEAASLQSAEASWPELAKGLSGEAPSVAEAVGRRLCRHPLGCAAPCG